MVIPSKVLCESFISRVLLLDDKPCQVRLGVLGARLILGRFPWSGLDLGNRLFNDPVYKGQSLHARVCQVILLLVLVENGNPLRLRLLNKGTASLDRSLFTLEVACTSWTGNVRHLVTCIVHYDILVMTEKVCV